MTTESSHSDCVRTLGNDARPGERRELGAKAWRLASMISSDIPVPPSICVLAGAFDLYLERNDAVERCHRLALALPDEQARRELVELVYAFEIPLALRQALDDALRGFAPDIDGRPLLAVRSSGVDEDGEQSSFAGQYISRLGVAPRATWPAIRACWASRWSPNAVLYRERTQRPDHLAGVAVLIQPMIDAEVSAVAFTCDPRDQSTDHLVVNATWGLGEGIVTGGVSSDVYRLARDSLALTDHEVGEKQSKVVLSPLGGTERVDAFSTGPCLDAECVSGLGRIALEIEAMLGAPADIEAALCDQAWHILQCRPITALAGSSLVGTGAGPS